MVLKYGISGPVEPQSSARGRDRPGFLYVLINTYIQRERERECTYIYVHLHTYTHTQRGMESMVRVLFFFLLYPFFFSPLSLFTYTERDGERVQWSAKKEKEFVEHKERKRVNK